MGVHPRSLPQSKLAVGHPVSAGGAQNQSCDSATAFASLQGRLGTTIPLSSSHLFSSPGIVPSGSCGSNGLYNFPARSDRIASSVLPVNRRTGMFRASRYPTSRSTFAFGSSVSVLSYTDRKSTRLNSSHLVISYAVFCLKKKSHITLPSAAAYIAMTLSTLSE